MKIMQVIISLLLLIAISQPLNAEPNNDTIHKLTGISVNNDSSNGWVSFEFDEQSGHPDIQKIEQSFPHRILIVLPDTELSSNLHAGLFYDTILSAEEKGIVRITLNQSSTPPSVMVSIQLADKLLTRVQNKDERVAVLEISNTEFPPENGGRLIASEDGLKSPVIEIPEAVPTSINEKMKSATDDIDKQMNAMEEILAEIEKNNTDAKFPHNQTREYRIQAGDKLDVSIMGEPDFQRNVVVRPDGFISYPLLGDVIAENLTPEELATIIKSQLMKVYFNYDISLTVTVLEYQPSKIYLLGTFAQAGPIEYRKGMTLLDILGHFDRNDIDLNRLVLIRKGIGRFDINLNDVLKGDIGKNFTLFPDDYIILPSNEYVRVMVLGKVNLPGMYRVRTDSRVYDAIASAGGVAERCDIHHIMILRENGDSVERINVDLRKFADDLDLKQNVKILDRDILFVPETGRFDFDKVLTVLQRAGQLFYDIRAWTR